MKSKIVMIALVAIFISSCKTKKAVNENQVPAKEEITEVVTVLEEKPILSPVVQNPETVELAATYDGNALYSKNCMDCHKLFAATDFSKEEWVPILKSMQKKARITDAETLAIYDYLVAQTE